MMYKKWKKMVVMILALMMLLPYVPSYGATLRFKDVPTTHWAYKSIEEMANLGYIAGKGNGIFDPNGTLTFQEAMLLLSRLTNPTSQDRTTASYAFSSLLNELNVDNWAKEGLAVCLYKGIITETELKSKKASIKKPINKVDTGEYLVKAIGLDDVAKSKTVLSSQQIPYKDYLSIQANQLKYVSVLLDIGVYDPKGTGNGLFEPKSTLTRAVMAKMMATAYDYLKKNPVGPTTPTIPEPPKTPEGETVRSTIIRISKVGEYRFLSVDNGRGGETTYLIMNDTAITVDGKITIYTGLVEGQEVELLVKKGTNELISIKSESVEETISGKIKTLNSTGYKMTVEYVENKKTITKEFTVDNKADIYLDDKAVYLRELKEGDLVRLEVKNSTIYDIQATSKVKKVEGYIKEITPVKDSRDKEYNITIVDSKDNTHKFLINSKTTLYRNDRRIDSGEELKLKDNVYVEAEYDLVNKYYIAYDVDAEVVIKTIKGIIVGMETRLQEATKLIILNQETKKEEQYSLGKGVYIRVDKVVANSYDLKAGFYVEVITEGDEITEIEASSAGVEATMIGKILSINSRSRSLVLEITDFSLDGSKYGDEITIYANDVVVLDRNGTKLSFEHLYRGDTINVIGSYDGSAFIANTIMILR